MDEFDKIREISEDLTHRREPTFTQLGQPNASHATQAPSTVPSNTPFTQPLSNEQAQRIQNINSFLNQPINSSTSSEKPYKFTGQFNDKIDFIQPDIMPEKRSSFMKLHLIGITVFAGILGIVLAGFFFFNNESDAVDEIITITTAPALVKEEPSQAGGMNIPNQDKLVYNRIRSGNITTKVESLFPEPEKPVMPNILAIEEEPEETFVGMNDVKAVNPLKEPAKPIIIEPQKVEETLKSSVSEKSAVEKKEQPTESVSAKQLPEKTTETKVMTPKVAESKPTILPLPKAEKIEKEVPIKQPTIQEAKQSGNVWRVQLFATNNKEAVEKAWKRISTTHKSLLSNMSYTIEPAEIKGKGTFYRLKVGQFATRDMAAALCTKLKAQKQDCVPTK